jgi:hypothetical protein
VLGCGLVVHGALELVFDLLDLIFKTTHSS